MNVSAKDKASGKEQQIRIQASGGLTEADIQRMVREAEEHAAEDRKRRELIEARNQADAAIYSTEKALRESGDRIGQTERRSAEGTIAVLRTAMEGEDLTAIRQKTEALVQAASQLGQAAHQATQNQPNNSRNQGGEDVVDAEFEEVDENNRRAS